MAYDVASSESNEDDYYESKKSAKKSLKEGISAFNKAIAKKYNDTEPNGAGQYYLDWRFDLHDEKDNIEAIADRCGVTVEFQSDEGYFEVFEESKKSAKRSLKESTDESFSLYDLNKHDSFVKEWIININKELRDVSIESIGDDEIVFRVWFDENIDLDIFDDIATDCMPSLLIEFMSDMNIDFNYQFVYEDDKFTENDFVFIRFVAW